MKAPSAGVGSNQYQTRPGADTRDASFASTQAVRTAVSEPDDTELDRPAHPLPESLHEAVTDDGLVFSTSRAMRMQSEKEFWMRDEAARRGWDQDTFREAFFAVDSAVDQSTDSLVWSRSPFADAVQSVRSGTEPTTPIERGVALQLAYTQAVWDARYGDVDTVDLSRVDRGAPPQALTSWTVRENEATVAEFFHRRYPDATVHRATVHRDDVVLLCWGEGRYRSDYVTVKGEVLVHQPPPNR